MYLIVYYEVPAAEGQIEELKQKFENFVRTRLLYNKELLILVIIEHCSHFFI